MTVVSQRSFSRGEISPDLWPRTDLASYLTGLRTCRNFIPKKTGGAQNRPGFNYVTSAKNVNGKKRLIPFIFSKTEAYALEFGAGYLRFMRNSAPVTEPLGTRGLVSNITQTATSTITAPAPLVANAGPFTLHVNLALNPTYAALDGQQFLTTGLVSGTTYHWTHLNGSAVDTTAADVFRAGTPDNPGATFFFSAFLFDISAANPAVVSLTRVPTNAAAAALANQDIILQGVVDANIVSIPQFNGEFRLGALINPAGPAPYRYNLLTRESFAINSTAYPVFIPAGLAAATFRPYEIASPYQPADLAGLTIPPQVADSMVIVHNNYPPYLLARRAETDWTLTPMPIGSSTKPPTAPSITASAYGNANASDPGTMGGGFLCNWFITAVDAAGVESPVTAALHIAAENGSGTWLTQVSLGWTAPATGGPYTYRIYRYEGTKTGTVDEVLPLPAPPGKLGLVGTTTTTAFIDNGTVTLDPTQLPVFSDVNPFLNAGNFPNCATFYQNRLMLGNTLNAPQTLWGSVTADYNNFDVSTPLKQTDSFNFTLTSNQLMNVNYMLYINPGFLLVFTDSGEWAIFGDSSGTLSPGNYNARQQSYYGSARGLKVIPIGKSALYVQASQTIIRDLEAQSQSNGFNNVGYDGDELTIFSQHLFENHSIVAWDYQMVPESVVWAVREDGVLLGMTYVKNQQVLSWHRHDTPGGVFTDVCVIPEGNESAVYVLVTRTNALGGLWQKIERLTNRVLPFSHDQGNGRFDTAGIVDPGIFMDSAATYEGRNTNGGIFMTLSGGTNWTYQEMLNLQAAGGGSFFNANMVGEIIVLQAPDGSLVQCKIRAVVNPANATVQAEYQNPAGGVPLSVRNVATTSWARAVTKLFGLWHLEGKQVAVLADGNVVSSPNEWGYEPDGVTKNYFSGVPLTVQDGTLTLPSPKSVVHVGLAYISDLETLGIDNPQGEALVAKKKVVGSVNLWLKESRGIWTGGKLPDPFAPGYTPTGTARERLYEFKARDLENYQNPVSMATRPAMINLGGSSWGLEARGCVRQLAPLPLTVTGIFPEGIFS